MLKTNRNTFIPVLHGLALFLLLLGLTSCGISSDSSDGSGRGNGLVDPIFTQPIPSLPSQPPVGIFVQFKSDLGVLDPNASYLDGTLLIASEGKDCDLKTPTGMPLPVPTFQLPGYEKLYYFTLSYFVQDPSLSLVEIFCNDGSRKAFFPTKHGIFNFNLSSAAKLVDNRYVYLNPDAVEMVNLNPESCILEIESTYVFNGQKTTYNNITPKYITDKGAYDLVVDPNLGEVVDITDNTARIVCQVNRGTINAMNLKVFF